LADLAKRHAKVEKAAKRAFILAGFGPMAG